MSKIEKMYENARIKPLPTCNGCNRLDEYWNNGTYCSTCKDDKDNDECGRADYIYPPFTAEKQIELIKWLAKKFVICINEMANEYQILTENNGDSHWCKTFDETIANFINLIWQDLTEEEKQQVKGILE